MAGGVHSRQAAAATSCCMQVLPSVRHCNIYCGIIQSRVQWAQEKALIQVECRSLNPKKLVDVQFSHLGARMTMSRMIKLYKLPASVATVRVMVLAFADGW